MPIFSFPVFIHHYVFSDGGNQFQELQNYDGNKLKIMASNASIWIVNAVISEAVLLQIDHFNKTSGTKYTRAMKCQQMPENKVQEEETCETLDVKVSKRLFKALIFNISSTLFVKKVINL